MANRTLIKRFIDTSCNKYKISSEGQRLITEYVKATVSELINECEKQAEINDIHRLFIPLPIIYKVCEQFLIAPDSFSDIGQVNDLTEVKEGRQYDKGLSESPEVA